MLVPFHTTIYSLGSGEYRLGPSKRFRGPVEIAFHAVASDVIIILSRLPIDPLTWADTKSVNKGYLLLWYVSAACLRAAKTELDDDKTQSVKCQNSLLRLGHLPGTSALRHKIKIVRPCKLT